MATFVFQNELSNELPVFIQKLLIKKGYKLEKGEKVRAIYGKESKVGPAFLGPFDKRFAFSVEIKFKNDITYLSFGNMQKAMCEEQLTWHK